jgi:ribulose-5-phosphate 4-epimerase/fuculose-1-phosphate aldolase
VDAKQMLVDAIRMLERAEIVDHSGHCSARRDTRSFYINSGASVRSTLSADDIVTVELDGALLEGAARPPLEFHIHSEIYRARPDVQAVIHAHPRWSTLLTMVGAPFQTVYAQAALLGNLPVLESPLSINSKAAGERLASTLGTGRAILLKSHGAVVAGSDMVECFALTTYLEENARRQYLAMQIGEPYVFSETEQQECRANLSSPALFKKSWDYFFSKLSASNL